MSTPVVAVVDIGKTNKKLLLYDESLAVVHEARCAVDTREEDGVEVEDTGAILAWLAEAFRTVASDFDVRAIACSAHGATLALLDDRRELAIPVISYTASVGEEVQEEFYELFGSREDLHRETCTPDIGFCNMAKILYYVKTRRPEAWARSHRALFYNSFFAHALTARRSMEPTYVGNHSYLWNFADKTWSRIGREFDAVRLFGNVVQPPWSNLGRLRPQWLKITGLPEDCRVTPGIHDSNANLLPYIAKDPGDFLLNSSGTWCVLMRIAESLSLSDDDVAEKVFFNQDVLARPVRTGLVTAGMDYDAFRECSSAADETNVESLRRLFEAKDLFVIPGVLPDASAFHNTPAQVVANDKSTPFAELRTDSTKPMTEFGQNYFAALNFGLALATTKKIRACGVESGTTVFVEGGFAKNDAYCTLLQALCLEQNVVVTNMTEGTAFGAALTAWMCAKDWTLEQAGHQFDIESKSVDRIEFEHLEGYQRAYEERLR